MRKTSATACLLTLILFSANFGHSQKPCTNSQQSNVHREPSSGGLLPASNNNTEKNVLIMSDNQEHNLAGVPLRAMGELSDRIVSSVAMRSPLAHVGGRLLVREVLRLGKKQRVDVVLHLGDASDISCPQELKSVFSLLDQEAKDNWFMALGNHDGMLLGTIASYQPSLNYRIKDDCSTRTAYNRKPSDGLGHKKRGWPSACLSPEGLQTTLSHDLSRPFEQKDTLRKGIMTRADAISLYVEALKKRKFNSLWTDVEQVWVEDTPVTCKVEAFYIPTNRATIIASTCPPTERTGKRNYWVGPFASYILQKLEIAGTTIILLDTSDYERPTVLNVALKGGLSKHQRRRADAWFKTVDRENVIVAGHHPIDDFPGEQERWIIRNTGRYMSGHVHRSTQLIRHKSEGKRTIELNVGSTIDHPSQVVMAKITSPEVMTFQVAGEGAAIPGFLAHCKDKWRLERSQYKNYRSGTYVNRLMESMRNAAAKHIEEIGPLPNDLKLPDGTVPEDWQLLEAALNSINSTENELSSRFWACQAYYASEATQGRSFLEWLKRTLRMDTKSGCDASKGSFMFAAP